MQLDRPAPPGDRFVNEQNVGNLLVIDVLSTEFGVQTENGPADCIRANVYVITPPGTVSAQYLGTLMFGKLLFSRLQQSVGRKVVGVLSGQPGVKVQGKNVPYDLDDPNDAMFSAASTAMTALEMQKAQQQQQPSAQGWGQQPQQSPWGGQQPAQQQPGWGQAPAGPPPGWGQPPAQQQPGWGQQPLPTPPQGPPPGWGQPPQEDAPPWEQPPAGRAPWGGGQQ